jgi:hypothetical protein
MSKKKWATPELVVMVRSMPEEAVLDGCKYGYKWNIFGPQTDWYGLCDAMPQGGCDICSVLVLT